VTLRTREDYLAALRALRSNIYKFGELIEDVTTHPATRRTVESHALNYDAASDPELADIYTTTSILGGERVLRWNSMMQSSADLIGNMRMERQNYRRTGSCTGAVCVGRIAIQSGASVGVADHRVRRPRLHAWRRLTGWSQARGQGHHAAGRVRKLCPQHHEYR
jgi:aromatic ring hydroxylase